jgi:hypothetical protein
MTCDEFNAFCRALPATTYVVQWGGSHVWKVGGKVLAIGGGHDGAAACTFKVNGIAYEMLKEQPGLRPAPYLCFARPEVDPALRKTRAAGWRVAGLYPAIAQHRIAGPVQEEADRAWSQDAIAGPQAGVE